MDHLAGGEPGHRLIELHEVVGVEDDAERVALGAADLHRVGEGSATGAAPAAPQHEPALGELRERVLEGGEVPADQRVDRPALRSCGAHPPAEHLRARLGLPLRLVDQRQQDPQLGAMVQLAGEQRQRVGAEGRAELILAEPQQLLQASRACVLTDVAFRVDRRIVASQPTR